MLVLVFHQKNWLENRFSILLQGEPDFVSSQDLELVAILEFKGEMRGWTAYDLLEESWALTQNEGFEQQDWSFIYRKDNERSTCISDVIQLETGQVFMVKDQGFKLLNQLPLIHVPQVEGLEKTGDEYFVYPTLEQWSINERFVLENLDKRVISLDDKFYYFYYLEEYIYHDQKVTILKWHR